MKPELSADDVAAYRARLMAEVRKPGWNRGSAWPESDVMFGTCRNDDCEGFPVMEYRQVGLWRKVERSHITTWQGYCEPCAQLLLNDGDVSAP